MANVGIAQGEPQNETMKVFAHGGLSPGSSNVEFDRNREFDVCRLACSVAVAEMKCALDGAIASDPVRQILCRTTRLATTIPCRSILNASCATPVSCLARAAAG
jgi:hypothetical protein